MVFDIVTGTGGSQPMNFCAVGNKLYFTATSPSFGNEVLVTEGLTGTTKLVTNVTGSLNPMLLTNVSGMLFFIGKEVGNTFNVLYACNGKSSTQITGCENVTNIAYANSKVYAVGEGVLFIGTTGVELFVTNSCPTPPKPIDNTSSDNLAICPGLSTTLEIESRKGIIGWYSAATGGTYLGTGLTYTTPVLTTSKSFFVQDSICGTSARLEIKVTVYDSVPAPSNVTTSANLKVCKNGSTTLLASGSSLGYITWYNAAVGGDIVETGNSFTTPAFTATTTYYAEDRVCDLGSRRTAFKVEVSNISATITSQTNIVCNGQTNGSATISPTGGFAGYTYSWSPFGGTAATATGLAKGTYICTIKDTKNCSNTKEVVITEPTALAILLNSQINISCNGEANGSATVAGSGGTAPYTYLWSNGGETTTSITNKGVGTYTCTVKDAKLCTQTKAVTITQPNQITSVVSAKTDPVCNGLATGTATITVAGGTTPYTYAWDNGAGTSKTITNRPAGTYTCIIKDKNNCEKTQQVVLVEPSAIIPSISSQTNPTCFGESNGSATVTATGGTPGYTYSWSPGGTTGATITNKADGTYTCTIKDSKQCTKTQEVVLVQPPFINRGITITLGGTKFTVDEVDATYQWFNCDNNQQIPGANQRSYVSTTSSGRFKVRITKNGCTVESACVDMNSAGLDDLQVNVMEVYPNPSTGEFTIEIPFNATVKITNMLGQDVYFNSVVNGKTLIDLSGLAKGVYNIKATSEEGENYLERVVID